MREKLLVHSSLLATYISYKVFTNLFFFVEVKSTCMVNYKAVFNSALA